MKPAVRRMGVLLLAAGAFGWSYWQGKAGHAPAAHDAMASASAGPVAPDVLRVGTLSFDPCNIGSPGSGVPTLRAYCTLLAVVDLSELSASLSLHGIESSELTPTPLPYDVPRARR